MSLLTCRASIFLLGVLGIVLLIRGETLAAPAPDSCFTQCQHKDLIITSPKLECTLFTDPICTFCNPGEPNSRCIAYVGPGQPYCVKTGTTKLKYFPTGSCQPKCTLPLNGTSESTFGQPPLKDAGDWDRKQCSSDPPPPP